jgi:hypothetical protein
VSITLQSGSIPHCGERGGSLRRRIEERRQNPNLFCLKRRKSSAPREFQSCMGSLRCRAQGFATRHPVSFDRACENSGAARTGLPSARKGGKSASMIQRPTLKCYNAGRWKLKSRAMIFLEARPHRVSSTARSMWRLLISWRARTLLDMKPSRGSWLKLVTTYCHFSMWTTDLSTGMILRLLLPSLLSQSFTPSPSVRNSFRQWVSIQSRTSSQ